MNEAPFVQGTSLGWLARQVGPFITLYVETERSADLDAILELIDGATADRAELTPVRTRLLAAMADHEPEPDIEALAFVANPAHSAAFAFVDPIRRPVCRTGRYPSLGPILEEHQLVASHVVVTVEGGRYGVTAFGSRAVPDAEGRSLGVTSSVETLIEELRFAPPRMIALAGSPSGFEALDDELSAAFPAIRLVHYPIDDLDATIETLATDIVRDAAAVAAEDIAHELGAFRAAAAEGLTVEGPAVIGAVDEGRVTTVLVHDDVDDDRRHGPDRLVDVVVARALAADTRVVMIPDVDDRRGPASGIGAILGGAPVGVAVQVEPELAATESLDEPEPPVARPVAG